MSVVQSEGALLGLGRSVSWSTLSPSRLAINTYAGRVATYAELYRVQPNVRLVVRFLGRNVAQLSLNAFEWKSQKERTPLDRDHDANRVVRRPNARTTRHRLIRFIVESKAIFDDAFVVKARHPETGALNLFPVLPQFVEPIGDGWMFPDGWRITIGGQITEVPAEAMIHLHGHNADDPRVGSSALEALRRNLAEEDAAGEWREQFWSASARMAGWISRPEAKRWGPEARERFTDSWVKAYQGTGGKAGQTPVLEDGMEFHESGFSPQESEYLGARKLSREEVAAQFFIAPQFVGILENANFSTMKESHKGLYQDTLGPILDEIEQDLDLQLLPDVVDDDRIFYKFNLDEKLQGDFETEAAALQSAVGRPWMTANEARAGKGLAPIEGGDELVTPLNVLVGGLASPSDTAPTDNPPDFGAASSARRLKSAADDQRRELWKRERDKYVEPTRRVLETHFFRQSSAILSALGAGKSVDEAFDGTDPERWDRELAADLLGTSIDLNADLGQMVAEHFGTDYDDTRAAAWLNASAARAARGINAKTRADVAAAITGTKSRRKSSTDDLLDELDDDPLDLEHDNPPAAPLDTPVDHARTIFELAVSVGVARLAISRVTNLASFSMRDGAEQSGARGKEWITTSADSRHADLDGEVVPLGEPFSNGGDWPGDASLGADETAGCTCLLDFTPDLP